MGHDCHDVNDSQSVARYARAQARSNKKRQIEDEEETAVPVIESEGVGCSVDETCSELGNTA